MKSWQKQHKYDIISRMVYELFRIDFGWPSNCHNDIPHLKTIRNLSEIKIKNLTCHTFGLNLFKPARLLHKERFNETPEARDERIKSELAELQENIDTGVLGRRKKRVAERLDRRVNRKERRLDKWREKLSGKNENRLERKERRIGRRINRLEERMADLDDYENLNRWEKQRKFREMAKMTSSIPLFPVEVSPNLAPRAYESAPTPPPDPDVGMVRRTVERRREEPTPVAELREKVSQNITRELNIVDLRYLARQIDPDQNWVTMDIDEVRKAIPRFQELMALGKNAKGEMISDTQFKHLRGYLKGAKERQEALNKRILAIGEKVDDLSYERTVELLLIFDPDLKGDKKLKNKTLVMGLGKQRLKDGKGGIQDDPSYYTPDQVAAAEGLLSKWQQEDQEKAAEAQKTPRAVDKATAPEPSDSTDDSSSDSPTPTIAEESTDSTPGETPEEQGEGVPLSPEDQALQDGEGFPEARIKLLRLLNYKEPEGGFKEYVEPGETAGQ